MDKKLEASLKFSGHVLGRRAHKCGLNSVYASSRVNISMLEHLNDILFMPLLTDHSVVDVTCFSVCKNHICVYHFPRTLCNGEVCWVEWISRGYLIPTSISSTLILLYWQSIYVLATIHLLNGPTQCLSLDADLTTCLLEQALTVPRWGKAR